MKATLSAATLVAIVLTGCSGEGIAEKVIENQIESESGEDVDLDLDNGNFSIKTEDGEFSVQADGDQTIIQSDDGSTVIGSAGGDLPEDFPSELPVPTGAVFEYTQQMTTPEGQTFLVGGSVEGEPGEALAAYVAALEAAGFEQQQLTTTPDGGFFAYQSASWTVSGTMSTGDDGMSAFGMTVVPSSE